MKSYKTASSASSSLEFYALNFYSVSCGFTASAVCRPWLPWRTSAAVGLVALAVAAVIGFCWSHTGGSADSSPRDIFHSWQSVATVLNVSYTWGLKPPYIFQDCVAGCIILVVLCGRCSLIVAFINVLGTFALGFVLGFWAKVFCRLGHLPLQLMALDPEGNFFLVPLFLFFVVASELDRLRASQRKEEARLLQLPQGIHVQDAECSTQADTNTIRAEIGDRWQHVETSVQVLLDSGMSTPALRAVRQHDFSVKGLADVKFSHCWLGLAVWLYHFLIYGCSDAVLGGINCFLMGITVVLWSDAERDDKAFLGSMSVKIVTLVFAACYAISYAFDLKNKVDADQKAMGGNVAVA